MGIVAMVTLWHSLASRRYRTLTFLTFLFLRLCLKDCDDGIFDIDPKALGYKGLHRES